jgi:hypothetical protein
LSTGSPRTARHCMPLLMTAFRAATDAGRPVISTEPGRVHAHRARSTTGALPGRRLPGRRPYRSGPVGRRTDLDQPPLIGIGSDELNDGARLIRRPLRLPASHHVDSVVHGTDSDVRCDGPGRQARGQLGIDAVHRRLVSLRDSATGYICCMHTACECRAGLLTPKSADAQRNRAIRFRCNLSPQSRSGGLPRSGDARTAVTVNVCGDQQSTVSVDQLVAEVSAEVNHHLRLHGMPCAPTPYRGNYVTVTKAACHCRTASSPIRVPYC